SDRLGRSGGMSGDHLIAGAPLATENDVRSGSVVTFAPDTPTGWTLLGTLTPSDATAYTVFGEPLDVSGDLPVNGDYANADQGTGSGAVYVYTDTGSGWEQVDKLYAPDAAVNGGFGSGLALDYPYAAIAAKYDDELGGNTGAVWVFRHDGTTWWPVAKLSSPT